MDTDIIILGGGPAGLTAAMYAARARIPLVVLEKGLAGGQMAATEMVENYPGFERPIFGADLALRMETQARNFGAQIVQAEVRQVLVTPNGFSVVTESDETHNCRALVIATGASPVKLGIPGELELAGRGVSYCAVCDGPFFRDTEVAVVGGGDSAVEEAVYLGRFASKVHLIHRREELRAVKHIQEKAFSDPKVQIHWSSIPVRVIGEKDVSGLRIRSVKDQSEEDLPVGGVFFYVGLRPNIEGIRDFVASDEAGFIITDRNMACSVPGVFAAGDIRAKKLRQIATAVGDGAIAAYMAQLYLESDKPPPSV
jgi:thioredoxin reductase (NADPH)